MSNSGGGQALTEELKFKSVVDAAPNSLIVVDKSGLIRIINSQTEKLFGYGRDELIGKPLEILIPVRFRAKHPAYQSNFFSHPSARPMGAGRDLFGLRKDNTEVAIEIGLNPLELNGEHFVIASIIDITERKSNEKQIHRYLEELERSNQSLDEFAYIVSHDLKEPVRWIFNHVNMMLTD